MTQMTPPGCHFAYADPSEGKSCIKIRIADSMQASAQAFQIHSTMVSAAHADIDVCKSICMHVQLGVSPALSACSLKSARTRIACFCIAGIVAEEVVEKMPPVLVSLCKRLVRCLFLHKIACFQGSCSMYLSIACNTLETYCRQYVNMCDTCCVPLNISQN